MEGYLSHLRKMKVVVEQDMEFTKVKVVIRFEQKPRVKNKIGKNTELAVDLDIVLEKLYSPKQEY